MGNRSFFNALHDREGDFLLATVLEGPAQGERVLLRNTAPVWPEELPAFWGEHLPALAAVTSSGILESAEQRIFVERFGAAPQLVVCGGGHVGASVVRLAKLLGLPVTALEDRPEFAEELRQAGADAVLCLPFAEGLAQIPGGQETYFVVVTRAHSCDIACLRSILQKPAAYVGMMGSRKRAALVHTQLAGLGLPQERIDALHAPIGLSIGAKTAQEIALSILAEIVSVKNSRQQTEGFSPALLAALRAAVPSGWHACIAQGSTRAPIWGELTGEPDGSGAMLHSFRYYGVPETYRILMVTASGETFLSDVLTRRTLQSSVTVDWVAKTAKPPLQSEGYLLQFAATFVPTILIELVVLLLFGFKLKENWKPFLLVNLVTQGLLHGYFALFAVNNGVGPWYFMLFIPAELVIALLEAFIYRAALKGRSKRRAFLCGLCANVCSAALGYFLAEPVWRFVVSIS